MEIEVADLVSAALAKADGSRAELGRRIGIGSYAEDQIGNWLRGNAKPGYERTIGLLQVAGWLNEDRIRSSLAPGGALDGFEEAEDKILRRRAGRRRSPESGTGTG